MVNLKTLPDDELENMVETTAEYLKSLESEQKRRTAIESAEASMENIMISYFQALGKKPGEPWEGASSAIEAYPKGWTATHEGRLWESLEPGNLEEPGEGEAWDDLGDVPDEGDSGTLVPSENLLPGEDVLPTGADEEGDE